MATNKPSTTTIEDQQARTLATEAAALLTKAVINYNESLGGRSKAIRASIYPTMLNTIVSMLDNFDIEHGLGEIETGHIVFIEGKE
jgi:hypothetical protein